DAGGLPQRKTAQRANTAERRATHNPVERMRRETLNGRFLVRSLLTRMQGCALTYSHRRSSHSSRPSRRCAARARLQSLISLCSSILLCAGWEGERSEMRHGGPSGAAFTALCGGVSGRGCV
ncbi:hypothetical protein B0H17DRAFT_920862, partial [Mycena rosella]